MSTISLKNLRALPYGARLKLASSQINWIEELLWIVEDYPDRMHSDLEDVLLKKIGRSNVPISVVLKFMKYNNIKSLTEVTEGYRKVTERLPQITAEVRSLNTEIGSTKKEILSFSSFENEEKKETLKTSKNDTFTPTQYRELIELFNKTFS